MNAASSMTGLVPGIKYKAVSETDWLAAHLFYQGDIDQLLVDLVAPLKRELIAERLADCCFFLRYWEGGNHVRLRMLVREESARDRVKELVETRGQEYFKRNPSPDLLWSGHYKRIAEKLARSEGLNSYTTELYPNNSVVFLPYRREHDRYGYGAAIQTVERHFVESSRIVLDLLARRMTNGQRDTICFSAILLAWFCSEPDPVRLHEWREPLYSAWAGRLAFLDEHTNEFADRFERCQKRLGELTRRLRAFAWGGSSAGGHSWVDGGGEPLSTWKESIAGLVEANVTFGVLDICVHLFCNRLGISPPNEVYLRYLATRCVDVLTEEGR